MDAANLENSPRVRASLSAIASALQRIVAVLRRMPEFCDPYIYFNRVRPYIHGWANHPARVN